MDERPGQERYVAGPVDVAASEMEPVAPGGFWREAWRSVRTRPQFIVSALLIVFVIAMAAFPWLFTGVDPTYADPDQSLLAPSAQHWFGTDLQGHDVYARTIYGARASISVGVGTTAAVVLVGATLGALAGFFGGWLDAVVSRFTDIFFGIPLLLAAIVVAQVLHQRTVWTVITVLTVFGWPQVARITRGAVIAGRNADYVLAAKALGVSRFGTLLRHVIPNALGPVIVVATISLGVFIVTEATLSYLGVGLPPSTVSWGGDINLAQARLRSGSPILFYPAGALAITVLAFMMMGDALRDALDPASSMSRLREERRTSMSRLREEREIRTRRL
jgi:oligopeptide transport system permease protein